MKYDVFLSLRAKKQFKSFDAHIRHKLKTELLELEEDPSEKGSLLQGFSHDLRYIKIFQGEKGDGVEITRFVFVF
ncbi:MAG: hypothetical protein JRI92_13815 [Deltaproteobacteria bacterium]|nr:hypothetical protein [Deltaproteobacteria bacterium]